MNSADMVHTKQLFTFVERFVFTCFLVEMCHVGVKRKIKEWELDPNAVNGGKIRETKGELY